MQKRPMDSSHHRCQIFTGGTCPHFHLVFTATSETERLCRPGWQRFHSEPACHGHCMVLWRGFADLHCRVCVLAFAMRHLFFASNLPHSILILKACDEGLMGGPAMMRSFFLLASVSISLKLQQIARLARM